MNEEPNVNLILAEQIMGYRRTGQFIYQGPTSVGRARHEAWDVPGMGLMSEDDLPDFTLPQFAFMLLEKLKMYDPKILWSETASVWLVGFEKHPAKGADASIGSAICRAALDMVSLRRAGESAE